jgi:LPS-assembly protein
VPTLLALAVAGLLAAAPVVVPGTGDARIQAATSTYDVANGTFRLEGHVVITRGVVTLRAGSARYDPRTGQADAAGGVILSDSRRVIAADGIHVRIDGPFEAHDVVVFVKTAPTDLSKATTVAEAERCGRNQLRATGKQVTGGEGPRLTLTGAAVTACDCQDGPPSWELRAESVEVEPGKEAVFSWPVLYVTPRFLFMDRQVPVMTLPWFTVPLAPRVTGLLVPKLGYSGSTGYTLEQPVFVTLGRSADITVTPRYAFGPAQSQVDKGNASVRGPGGTLEARWAPVERAAGLLRIDAMDDLDNESIPSQGIVGATGLRLALGGGWSQQFTDATLLRVDLDVVGDALYVRDFNSDVRLRDVTSRRSAVLLSHRTADLALELSTVWLQPVASNGALTAIPNGVFGSDLPAFMRWPTLDVSLAPISLVGPLHLSGRLGATRYAPPRGYTSDGGLDGVGPADRGWRRDPADPAELDGLWEPGERLGATRLDARAELAAPVQLGWLAVEPYLRGAALGYAFDHGQAPIVNGWGVGGLRLSTLLSRRFGEMRHVIEPRLEWVLGSRVFGTALPAFDYDGWDRGPQAPAGVTSAFTAPRYAAAAPPGRFQQARLSAATWLETPGFQLLRGEIGQEFDVELRRPAEGFVSGVARRGLVTGEVDVRFWTLARTIPSLQPAYSSWLDRFSEIRLRLTVADGRGDEVHGGLLAFGPGGSGRIGNGTDSLFDPRPINIRPLDQTDTTGPQAAEVLSSGSLGGKLRLGPATLGYDVLFPARTVQLNSCQAGGPPRTVDAFHVQQQSAWFEWNSPCNCFRLKAKVTANDCGGLPGVGFELGFGQVGATHFD